MKFKLSKIFNSNKQLSGRISCIKISTQYQNITLHQLWIDWQKRFQFYIITCDYFSRAADSSNENIFRMCIVSSTKQVYSFSSHLFGWNAKILKKGNYRLTKYSKSEHHNNNNKSNRGHYFCSLFQNMALNSKKNLHRSKNPFRMENFDQSVWHNLWNGSLSSEHKTNATNWRDL